MYKLYYRGLIAPEGATIGASKNGKTLYLYYGGRRYRLDYYFSADGVTYANGPRPILKKAEEKK